jgi:branched-chain amino acid transport system substrate-binding protein
MEADMRKGVLIKLTGALAIAAGVATLAGTTLAARQAADVITINGSEMLTGNGATYGQAVTHGIEIGVDWVNAHGGILGKKVKLNIADNASSSPQTVNLVRKFGQDASNGALISPTYDLNWFAACAVANSLAIPLITAQSSPPNSSQNPKGYCFTATSPIAEQTKSSIDLVVKKLGVKRFALIHDQGNLYQSTYDKVMASYMKQKGYTLTTDEAVATEAPDYSPQITKIIQSKPDIVIPNLTTEDAARFIQQAKARGLKAVFFSPDTNLTSARIYSLSHGAAEGLITANNQSPAIAGYKQFVKTFEKRFGKLEDPSYSGYGFDALVILSKAMNKAGTSTDREKIKAALESMKNVCASICYTYNGAGAFLTKNLYFVKLTKNGWVTAKELR